MRNFKMESWRKELYLAHHGILGMKWGVQKGPPYPLDAEDHSASEKKAGWRKSLDGGSGQESKPKKKLTKESSDGRIKKHIPKMYSEEPEWTLISDTGSNGRTAEKLSSSSVSKGMVVAGIALAAIGTYAAYRIADNAATKSFQNFLNTPPSLSPQSLTNARAIVKGLVQRNADTSITSLGETFSNAREFNNHLSYLGAKTQSHEIQNELFDKSYWDSLSADKKAAVKAYTGQHGYLCYFGMNKLLRMGADAIPKESRGQVKKLIKDCTDALEHSILQDDTICYRGVPLHTISKMFGGLVGDQPLTKGAADILLRSSFTEKGFYSSSIKESSSFSGVTIKTIIPKGMKAMYVSPISVLKDEKELLVQRGTTFKVKDFETDAAGVLIGLTVEAIRQL